MPLTPVLRNQRQEDLCELETILVYREIPGHQGVHNEPSLKKAKKKARERERENETKKERKSFLKSLSPFFFCISVRIQEHTGHVPEP